MFSVLSTPSHATPPPCRTPRGGVEAVRRVDDESPGSEHSRSPVDQSPPHQRVRDASFFLAVCFRHASQTTGGSRHASHISVALADLPDPAP